MHEFIAIKIVSCFPFLGLGLGLALLKGWVVSRVVKQGSLNGNLQV